MLKTNLFSSNLPVISGFLPEVHSYGFNGKEKENEHTSGNYDFGARILDTRLGRWMSVDAARTKHPFESTYLYAGCNPIFYVDPNGQWKVRWADNKDHSKGIVLEAEKGDNLKTLATQLGIPYDLLLKENFKGKDWSVNLDLNGKWLRSTDLPGVEVFGTINDMLANPESMENFNCAATAMKAVSIDLEMSPTDAYGNVRGEESLFNEACNLTEGILESNDFKSITEKDASVGDIVTYELSKSSIREDAQREMELTHNLRPYKSVDEATEAVYSKTNESPQHYSVVLLKDPSGTKIQQVFEKAGSRSPAIGAYQSQKAPSNTFVPSGKGTGSSTPIKQKQ